MNGLHDGRILQTINFNGFLIQECNSIEHFYDSKDRHDVAPSMIRGIYMSQVIGEDPFTQQVFLTSEDEQPGQLAEAAEAAVKANPDKVLAGAFFLGSLSVKNKDTDTERKMLLVSGKTTDGRANGAIYFYETDEDGRYYVVQDTLRPYDPDSLVNMEIRVPALDAYFKAWSRAKFGTR